VFKLTDSSFIIAPYTNQKNYNSQEYIILCRFGYDKSASDVSVHSLIGMSSYIVNGVQYNQVISQKDITDLSTKVQQNTTDIEELKDSSEVEDYISLYHDSMKSISDVWEQPENGAGFTFDSNGAKPNAIGETTYIRLKKIYHSDKRYMRIGVKMGIDTKAMFVMSWSWNNQQVINVGEGASCFAVDFSNKKLLMYAGGQGTDEQPSGEGYDTSNVIESVDIPQEAIGSRDYIIEIHKDGLTSKLILMDKLSGVHVEVAHTGWAVGRQNQYYGFYCESGTLPTFHDIDIESLNRPDIVFVGDSITEGVYVNDRTQRYAEKFRSLYPNKKIVISARGGDYANGVLWKFPTEFDIYRPKVMSLLIGANGGNTEANLTQIKQKCDAIGCKLYIHHCTCQQSDDSHIEKNRLIDSLRDSLGIDGADFDIATAKEYYPLIDKTHESPRYKPSLYGDSGLHPNVEGNAKMFERLLVDTPSLFYNTTSSK
jgi:lysophospholipase L1-like esterase